MSGKIRKIVILLSIILSISLLTGCLLPNQNTHNSGVSGSYAQYYKGSDGVDAEFENLNPRLYYYVGGTDDENSFNFNVKVHNKGTSYTKGATFISGYDPNLLFIEGQNIQETQGHTCNIDISQIGTGSNTWGGSFECNYLDGSGFEIDSSGDDWSIGVNSLGELLNNWGANISNSLLESLSFNFGEGGEEGFLNIGFDAGSSEWHLFYHGKYLSILISEIFSFEDAFGREYTLAADNEHFPGGEIDYIDYHVEIQNWPYALEEYPLKLLLTNCYGYATYTAPMACIDPNPMSDREKACEPRDISLSNQGAPVAVTKIEQVNSRKKSIFTIHIKNVGAGDVIYWGDMGRCSPYSNEGILTSKNKNVVQGFEVRIEDQALQCTPENKKIRLDPNGKGVITCSYNLEYMNLQSAYQTPLIIEFWYGYMETEHKNILIKKMI